MIGYTFLIPKPHLWGGPDFGEILFSSQINIMSGIQEPIPAAAESKEENHRRRRFQYSLRTLLIFVSIVGVLCGWLGMFIQRVQHQRNIVAQIKDLGGKVYYDYQTVGMQDGNYPPPGPKMIRWILGDDVFAHVEQVLFTWEYPAKDKDIALLRELPHLKHVSLDGPGISDEGLKIVGDLPNLQGLNLSNTNITGEGLGRLNNIKKIEWLSFSGATVNDATLKQIEKFSNLHFLQLVRTSVTNAGMVYLAQLSQLRSLDLWQNAEITDVSRIAELMNLEGLSIIGNSATDKGFAQLSRLYNWTFAKLS